MNRVLTASLFLFILAASAISYRIWHEGVRLDTIRPGIGYLMTMRFDTDLHGEETFVQAYLPEISPQLRILSEKTESSRLSYTIKNDEGLRIARWEADNLFGQESGVYESTVLINHVRYEIPDRLTLPDPIPENIVKYLHASDAIPSDDDELIAQASLLTNGHATLKGQIESLYNFVRDEIKLSGYETSLDALTALHWKEAHCGGKSRLLVGLLRAAGIPARLKGGFVLAPGSMDTHRLWVEVWINGYWVPFDPVENIFAEQRSNVLAFFNGDDSLFLHSENINFSYICKVKKWRVSPEELMSRANNTGYSAYSIWTVFRKAHISLNLLRILLLLPIAALIVLIARSVIGMATLGTFLPALVAVSFRDTGLIWGLLLLVTILFFSGLIRRVIDQFQMMHTARLAVVLTFVIFMILLCTHLAIDSNVLEPANISMFPIAIMTIQTERIFNMEQERGFAEALKVTLGTILLIICCYLVIDSDLLQALIFAFPELLLAVIGFYLVLGRWSGIRLLELKRFRWLLVN